MAVMVEPGRALIGVYGGTFDPVHLGHLRTAFEVREQLGLQRVLMVPARDPPHRGPPGADADQRRRMLALALAGVPGLALETCELERDGPSYMVDTLSELCGRYPDSSLVLILGQDAFLGLATWHRWPSLFDLAHIAVMTRPGSDEALSGILDDALAQRWSDSASQLAEARAGRVCRVVVSQLAISATAIRQQVAEQRDPRFLVTDPVREFILGQGLYRR
jgi:nicotinate-nucleotide adenylyltransferase